MVTTFTYKLSLVRIDARYFELSWRDILYTEPEPERIIIITHKHTRTRTDRTDYNTLRRS